MRISGGKARGIPLKAARRAPVRPATDRMREAVFSSLGALVDQARCLDLFAGTGAYGLEALSRGAAGVRFVEKEREGIAVIGMNLEAVCKSMEKQAACCRVEQRDVFAYVPEKEAFDLVFADPPYAMLPGRANEILDLASAALVPGGRLIFEMPANLEASAPTLELKKRIGKGRNEPSVCIFVRKDDNL